MNYPYQPGDCFQMHTYEEWLTGLFREQQKSEDLLKILGYNEN